MKKFKLNFHAYIFGIVAIIITAPELLILNLHQYIHIILIPVVVICFLISLKMMFTCTCVDENHIEVKSLIVKKHIEWDGVCKVCATYNVPFIYKYSIVVMDHTERIYITNWTKNSKELIKIIIAECKKRNIKVELMVEKIIED